MRRSRSASPPGIARVWIPIKPVLLVLAGGLGLPMLEKSVRHLFRLKRPVQIVTVAGKNESLRERLNRLAALRRTSGW